MRYEYLLEIYSRLSTIYTGIALGLLMILAIFFLSEILPKGRIKTIARAGVIAIAVIEYLGLLALVTIGSVSV